MAPAPARVRAERGHATVSTIVTMPYGKHMFVSGDGAGHIIEAWSRTLGDAVTLAMTRADRPALAEAGPCQLQHPVKLGGSSLEFMYAASANLRNGLSPCDSSQPRYHPSRSR